MNGTPDIEILAATLGMAHLLIGSQRGPVRLVFFQTGTFFTSGACTSHSVSLQLYTCKQLAASALRNRAWLFLA